MQLNIEGRRDVVVWSAVVAGLLTVAVTESLSALHALAFYPILLTWTFVAIVMTALVLRIRWRFPPRAAVDGLSWFCVAASLVIWAVITVTAWYSPPNVDDVLSYHFPRIVYWMQNASVAVFPAPKPTLNFMPPFAEYSQLQLYLLTGEDRLPNCIQSAAFLCLVCVISLIARELGANMRGQTIAGLTASTIPSVVLQASGGKNDVVTSLWLAALMWFTLRHSRRPNNADLFGIGAAFALALLTKGTAFVIGPPLLLPVLYTAWRRGIWELARITAGIAILVVLVNGPFQLRSFGKPGSRFGMTVNSRPGAKPLLSNALRVGATLLGSGSETANKALFKAVKMAHAAMGQDLNAPGTTMEATPFETPKESRREASAPNVMHVLLLIAAFPAALWLAIRKRSIILFLYCTAICVAFVAFCAMFRYQPYHARLVMPLLAMGAALVGVVSEALLPTLARIVLVGALVLTVLPYLFGNELRPLTGGNSIYRTEREDNYFRAARMAAIREQHRAAERFVLNRNCKLVGIDYVEWGIEYPLMHSLRKRLGGVRFYYPTTDGSNVEPLRENACAIVCLGCAGSRQKQQRYANFQALVLDPIVVYYSSAAVNP